MTGHRYIDVNTMCVKFDCGRGSIYRWEKEGAIPQSYKVGAKRKWREGEVDDHIAATQEAA